MRSRLRALPRPHLLGAVAAALVAVGALAAVIVLPGASTGAQEPAPVTEVIAATGAEATNPDAELAARQAAAAVAADAQASTVADAVAAQAVATAQLQAYADGVAQAEFLAALPQTAADDYWDRMAMCETGGNWAMTGSRFSGGVGFANSTWVAFGGTEFTPNAGQATREQQIAVANRVAVLGYGNLGPAGYGAWGCTARVGRP